MPNSSIGILGQTSSTCTGLGAVAQAVSKSSVLTDNAIDFIPVLLAWTIHQRLQCLL
jgi:hypothetical protein